MHSPVVLNSFNISHLLGQINPIFLQCLQQLQAASIVVKLFQRTPFLVRNTSISQLARRNWGNCMMTICNSYFNSCSMMSEIRHENASGRILQFIRRLSITLVCKESVFIHDQLKDFILILFVTSRRACFLDIVRAIVQLSDPEDTGGFGY